MKQLIILSALILLAACNTTGVKKTPAQKTPTKPTTHSVIDKEGTIIRQKELDNGIAIAWYKQGKGNTLHDGEMVMIDYKVKLANGTIVDGNHLLNKKALPFLIGYQMQTIGWDIALKELKVGDIARIVIPSKLARGEKGVKGLIPPNADNLLMIHILSELKPTRTIDGTNVWLLEENTSNKLRFNEKTSISFHGIASSPSNPSFVNTFRSNQPFTYKLSDHGLIPGLRKALINTKKSDRLYTTIPASEAYKDNGFLDIVKPNESIFYNIFVMDVTKN